MPRPKKSTTRTPGETIPTQMRLKADELARIDFVAQCLTETSGFTATRSDAVRFAAKLAEDHFRKKRS